MILFLQYKSIRSLYQKSVLGFLTEKLIVNNGFKILCGIVDTGYSL